ncbi:hypothetical protein HPB52_013879 [Rhipicephalus sanguineus]|uniref:E2 ubiquitin-conjugating enzyme n=1 Tax=Rhipicephalus sanguineus TaxID=34632 RepID=A0A9D4SWY5_RHISA|nr:hypothetical protein HPB52_013879 [Rhipicephalus sanguineus]
MPTLTINTNVPACNIPNDFLKTTANVVADSLGKPLSYVVVHISPDQMLSFGGTDEPCAIANLYSIGCLSPKENKKHSAALFEHIEKTLGIKGNRKRVLFVELKKNPVEGFSAGLVDDNDIYKWEVLIIGPPDTLYEGGFFKAHLQFPKEYPLRPPKMKFITEIWHPNIEKNGDVCISILHEPGDDKYGYEKASERWLPVHTVETILISVISMLADPNDESPANVDAAVTLTCVFFSTLSTVARAYGGAAAKRK